MSLPPPPPVAEAYVFKPRAGGMYTLENLPVGTRFAYGTREGVLLNCNFSEAKVQFGSEKPLYWSPATPVRVLGDNEKIQNSSPEVSVNGIEYRQNKTTSPKTETGVRAMKIQKTVAVNLLNALGVKSVTAKQKCEQLQDKLTKLLPKVEDPEIVKDAELRETLEEVMQSAAAGKPVEVVEDSGEKEVEVSEKPKGKPQKLAACETKEEKPKAANNPDKKEKGGSDRDKFGARKDSQVARINACLGKKAKDVNTIIEEAKAKPGSVRSHLRTLTIKGVVVVEDGKYKLKA